MAHPDQANERRKGSKKSKSHQQQADQWAYRMQTASEIITIWLMPGGKLIKAGETAFTLLGRGL